jgi:hypothetical protein
LILEDWIGRDTGWGRDREKGRKGKKEQVLYTVYILWDSSSARSEDGWVGL